MLTMARYLLAVTLTAVLVTGPVLSAPSLPTKCALRTDSAGAAHCSADVPACCAGCSGGEKSCCQRSNSPGGNERDAACGNTCPTGNCGCCQTSQGLTVACVLPDGALFEPRVLAVPVMTADSVLISRSDEPLLPPPIA